MPLTPHVLVSRHCKRTRLVKYVILTGYALSSFPLRGTTLLIDTTTSTRLLNRHFELFPCDNVAEEWRSRLDLYNTMTRNAWSFSFTSPHVFMLWQSRAVKFFVNAEKLRFQFYIFGGDFRLCSSNALDLIRKTPGSKLCRITRNENLYASWFTSVSLKAKRVAGKSFKCGVTSPSKSASILHLAASNVFVFIWKVSRSATINPQTILPKVYRGLIQFPQQDNVILH